MTDVAYSFDVDAFAYEEAWVLVGVVAWDHCASSDLPLAHRAASFRVVAVALTVAVVVVVVVAAAAAAAVELVAVVITAVAFWTFFVQLYHLMVPVEVAEGFD